METITDTKKITVVESNQLEAGKSIQNHLENFLNSQDVKPTSRDTYRRALKQFIKWITRENITSPTRETILKYKNLMETQGLSSLTISAYLVAVRKFFEWTEGNKFYPNIAKGIKGTKRSKGFQKDPLTVPQIKDFLEGINRSTLRGKRDYCILNLLVRTGLRTIEVIRADIEDIRQEGGEAVLWIQGKGRNSKDEFVLLTGETLKPIQDYLLDRGKAENTDPLFSSLSDRNKDGRLTTRSIRGIVKENLRKIGIDSGRITAHSLRHTFGVMSIRAGSSLYDVQLAMRHSDPATTEIYLRSIEREKRLKDSPERKFNDYLLSMGVN